MGHQQNVPEPQRHRHRRRRCINGRWMEMYGAVVYTVSCSLLSARPSIMILNSYAAEHVRVHVPSASHSRRLREGNPLSATSIPGPGHECRLFLMTSLYRSCGYRLMLICLATGVDFIFFFFFFYNAILKTMSSLVICHHKLAT